jgi:hypothetical protein
MKPFKRKSIIKIIFLTTFSICLVIASAHSEEKTKLSTNSNMQQNVNPEAIKIKIKNTEQPAIKIHATGIKQDNEEKLVTINKVSFNFWTGWSEPIW